MSQRAEGGSAGHHHRGKFDPSMRIGDSERNEVIDALGQHYSAGRLDESELKERLDQASAAKTGTDLAGILTDLPPLAPPPPPVAPRPRRTVLWALAAVVLLALAIPWHVGPWGWWFPHPPLFLVAVVLLVVWGRSRRRGWRPASRI